MSENQPPEENLRKEFETLGKNLVEALRSAWEAPESRRMRDELTGSLGELGTTLKREAEELAASPAASKVRTSVGEVGDKLRAPEMQNKVRTELIGALQSVNSELQKVIDRWSAAPAAEPSERDAEMGAAPEAASDPNAEAGPAGFEGDSGSQS